MQYDKSQVVEDKFHRKLRCAYGKVFTKEAGSLPNTIRLKHPNDDWYYKSASNKDKIVLHFTAGVLHGDIGELTRQRVSVAYVLARDGTVYELFDPKYWSYHLGRGATGGNQKNSKSSIGIEISNFGPLTLSEDKTFLKTWSDKSYCRIDQTEAYVHVKEGYRGHYYFATYTDAQYRALDSLITNICREHNILRRLPPVDQRGINLNQIGEGIWSHENFRADKLDVGPAFDWMRVGGR